MPRGRGRGGWYFFGLFLLIMMLGSYLGPRVGGSAWIVELLSSLGIALLIGTSMISGWITARHVQREQQLVQRIEESIQLRRWSESASLLLELLSQPMRSHQSRMQSLVYLASVLSRYHQFNDAVTVYENLLDGGMVDPGTAFGLRLGRAMALLREDRLVDANQALTELRRLDEQRQSGGLALLEIYRDVKTGHPQEAIELFQQKRELMREQLGHRAADGYALAARAQDMLNNENAARELYDLATLLAPAVELARRYPEIAPLSGKYPAAMAPAEAA